ncbi:DUF6894 family protein [Methylobacterium oryzae]|uniref:DUF6894 family protein n=1 Tax=Methylobacterium oryzae TaxID=334852 RepID=UPI001F1FBB62|nr:hypothetical protein [Methylobacterium oryzae]UIN38401.1 hypothetical protein LXM90_30935 [Methylobacterium oryzae]
MSLFFFDIDGEISSRDRVGRELSDRYSACREAVGLAMENAMSGAHLSGGSEAIVRVRRADDEVVCTVTLTCRIEPA